MVTDCITGAVNGSETRAYRGKVQPADRVFCCNTREVAPLDKVDIYRNKNGMETDDAAAIAWKVRMKAMRHCCEAAINALSRDKRLSPLLTREQAIDTLWTMLSVRNWEQLVHECGWTPEEYGQRMKALARRLFVTDEPRR